jgi:hypothetical protein
MPDAASTFNILAVVYLLTALIWGMSALSAYSGYRAFHQQADLGWTLGFALLAILRFGDAYLSRHWANGLAGGLGSDLGAAGETLAEYTSFYELRFSAMEIAVAILVFLLFRMRRVTF